MRVNGFRCDACCKEHLLAPSRVLQYHGEGLPSDWLIVNYGSHLDNHVAEQPMIFCSKKCLGDWVEKENGAKEPKETDSLVSKRRLILTLSEDLLADPYVLEKRVKAILTTLTHTFPGILATMIEKPRTVGPFREMVFIVREAEEKLVKWAKNAKECGLIDSYIYDYDPED